MLEITSLNFRSVPFESDTIMAFVSIEICGALRIHNLKVIKSNKDKGKNYFVAFPSRKTGDDKYFDIVHPTSKGVRKKLSKLIISQYKEWRDTEEVEEEDLEKVDVKLSEDIQ